MQSLADKRTSRVVDRRAADLVLANLEIELLGRLRCPLLAQLRRRFWGSKLALSSKRRLQSLRVRVRKHTEIDIHRFQLVVFV